MPTRWTEIRPWLTNAAPDDAIIAAVRLIALLVALWLIATTTLYLLARLSHVPALVRGIEWATLPAVRRVVDTALAASLVGASVLTPARAWAQAPSPPPIVVDLDTTTTVPGHLYVPVPAGDGDVLATTTTAAVPAPPTPTTASAPPAPTPSTPLPSAPEAPAPAPDPAGHAHTVVPGDNLWTISAAELTRQTGRNADHLAEAEIRAYWLKVIAANRAHLRSGDPNLIFPGESILCPPAT